MEQISVNTNVPIQMVAMNVVVTQDTNLWMKSIVKVSAWCLCLTKMYIKR